ncbi:type II toxin-antitoxin system VapC family toxin [Sphingomonas sp. Leaf343]|uniref:type II toxin-antitoxin system VapC family toxin n=1 Tax=Sphingomonas sp. Leaf343 TaxID=1736345 RepID=UPI0006FE2CD3|nr:type II toxin-antitoxin system VapC family toxin [Sphingomonas sp. Leaf343]KQR80401.1 hypothetical protein ASG07_14670 [Sphingomonas sp. Leaf343]
MIAVDTSAIIAIALAEPEAERFDHVLSTDPSIIIGVPTLLEARMVLAGRFGPTTAEKAMAMLADGWQVIHFTTDHLAAATEAFDRFGKGRHPARLNYGDCMAYAVAKVAGCPLLYKGDDFARTDMAAA